MKKNIFTEIQKLNDRGAYLLNNKLSKDAKNFIDNAYKLLIENQISDLAFITPIVLNKVIIEREFKNFSTAQNILNELISKLEDNFPSENLIKAKLLSATIKTDIKDFDNAVREFNECIFIIEFLENNFANLPIPGAFGELKSEVYNNLAMTYSFIGNLNEALEYYNKTLDLYENNKNAKKYKFNKADTLNNIGIMYQKFNRDLDAIQYFNQALNLHDNEYYIAMVYNNLSNSYRKLKDYDSALKFRKKSKNIREQIYLQNAIYADNYADELNNYGNLLNEMGQYKEAIVNFLESLNIFNKLSETCPEKYGEKVASTSVNIAGSYYYISDFDEAKEYCNEALKFFRSNYDVNPIEYEAQICGALSNLSAIELHSGNITNAEKIFQEIFGHLSKIKTLLSTSNKYYFYAYKSRVEKILDYLMHLYLHDPDKLLMIIENKRNEDFIYDKNFDIVSMFKYINNEILITIELVPSGCIFIITNKKGNKIFTIKSNEFISKCNELLNQVHNICYENENKKEDYMHAFLLKLGNDIFNFFPDEVKDYFCNNDNKIFLSLDQNFINFPFEFLANGKEFIGEKHLLPRVSGFNMFNKIINSNPKIKFQNKKLIVLGDDKGLSGAKSEYKILSKKDTLNPNISLSRLSATQNKIKNNLDNSIALFHFCGHGSEPDKLLLNFGKEMIDSAFFENYTFKNNPLFFINCCLSGTLEYYGGGKFNGLPITLFKQGVEAIISCTYPIRDNPSKIFSLYFYEKLLEGCSLGNAIMFARSKQKNPWDWGLHYLYGNPNLQIDTN